MSATENTEPVLDQAEYKACDGLKCIYCKSEHICGSSWSMDVGEVSQTVSCDDCGESWTDVYVFDRYVE